MSSVYSTQQRASIEVMSEMPSPCFPDPAASDAQHRQQAEASQRNLQLLAKAQALTLYRRLPGVEIPPPSAPGAVDAFDASSRAFVACPPVETPAMGVDRVTGKLSPPQRCPMYAAFGFCVFGSTCLLPHDWRPAHMPLSPKPSTLQAAIYSLIEKGNEHTRDRFVCGVCGFSDIDETCVTKVGEMYTYRYCRNCTVLCYFPYLMDVLEMLIHAAGDDYQLYKDFVDRLREAVPDVLKVPVSYEAHRLATTVFAWSLIGPEDAALAMTAVLKHHPKVNQVLSVGSGTGYVEHVFNRVVNGCPASPHRPTLEGGKFSYFDGVSVPYSVQRPSPLASIMDGHPYPRGEAVDEGAMREIWARLAARPLQFFAFDEIIRPAQFSIKVNIGAPNVIMSFAGAETCLLLCWPPFGSPQEEQSSMGFETLRNFYNTGGEAVIYIGDQASTGDWRFHEMLHSKYSLVHEYKVRKELRRWFPQEMGLVYAGNDTIGVYTRRQEALPVQQWSWQRM